MVRITAEQFRRLVAPPTTTASAPLVEPQPDRVVVHQCVQDDDGKPYGTDCDCPIGADHDENGDPASL